MKATINEVGRLLITPENTLESYAMRMWLAEYNKERKLHIFVEPVQPKEEDDGYETEILPENHGF